MRHFSTCVLAAFTLLLPPALHGEESAALVDRLLRTPGSYGQICDATPVPVPVPLPAFQVRAFGEAGFSPASIDLMKANRSAVVGELRRRLATLDFTRPLQPQEPDPEVKPGDAEGTPVGVDPLAFSPLVLDMIVKLKAIETLPELLTAEEKLQTALTNAEKNPAAPPPQIDGIDGAGIYPEKALTEAVDEDAEPKELTEAELAKYDRDHRMFTAECAHRDTLAVIVSLLRYQGMDAVLQSPLEKTYGKKLQENAAADEDLAKIKSREDIPADQKDSYAWDNVHKAARYTYMSIDIPYSPELRATIRSWAEQWILEHPAKTESAESKAP